MSLPSIKPRAVGYESSFPFLALQVQVGRSWVENGTLEESTKVFFIKKRFLEK